MGKYDSSLTRVQPVFSAFYEKDRTGVTWLHQLMELATHDAEPERRVLPVTLGPLMLPPQFELLVDPPRAYLKWLIEHPEQLSPPADTDWWESPKKTPTRRRALLDRDRNFMLKALTKLDTCRCLPRRAWWRFEGITHVDCALLTQSTVIFVEGKRTEKGPSKQVTWYPHRNQVLRLLDCAAAFAQQTGRPHFFALLVVERDLVRGDPERQMEIDAIMSQETIRGSLPHLAERERAELMSHYLGATTWQDIVERLDLGQDVLIDRVDC